MRRPTLRERLKPAELVGFAAILGAFVFLIVTFGARDVRDGAIFGGIAFIVTLLVLAMLALAAGDPGGADDGDERSVLDRNDDERNRGD